VAGESDPGLKRSHAAAAQLAVAQRVLGQAPGDAHEGVAVLWQALTGDAAAALEAGRLPDGRARPVAAYRWSAVGNRWMGRLWAAKLAARMTATPGRVVRIWPGVAASSRVI